MKYHTPGYHAEIVGNLLDNESILPDLYEVNHIIKKT